MRVLRPLVLSLLLVLGGGITALSAQNREVSGKVLDANQQPLVGVAVLVDGTTKGVTTSENGTFKIQVPSGEAVLQVTCLGYLPQKVTVPSSRNSITIYLQEDAIMLDATVVIGYGTQKKVNLTGAVATVGSKELENRVTHSLGSMLQGSVAGLNITTSSGKPGSTPAINIRGVNSINSADPLVLIDGVVGDLNRVNPNDVESISVIKDASAAAVYGARAAFGVILVTTKNGSAQDGKATVRYSGRFGWEEATTSTDYENRGYWSVYTVNKFWQADSGTNYVKYNDHDMQQLLARVNDRTEHPDRPWVVEEIRNGRKQWVYYGNYDWWDMLFQQRRPVQQHNISLSGGTKDIKYLVSGAYDRQEGIQRAHPDVYNKYNLRAKLDFRINRWATLSNNTSFFSSNYKSLGDGSVDNTIAYSARHALANFPMKNPDGSWLYSTPYLDYKIANGRHILLNEGTHRNVDRSNDFSNTTRLVITPFKTLSITGDFTYRLYQNRNTSRSSAMNYREYPDGPLLAYDTGAGMNQLDEVVQTRNYYSANVYANYDETFGEAHHVSATAGFNYETWSSKNVSVAGINLSSINLDDLNLATGSPTEGAYGGGQNEYALAGFFARINYDYKGRYLFEVSGRYDGSSRFAPGNRWGLFPSASAGWRISEEPFFGNAKDLVDNLKLRASFGSLGNQNVSSYYTYMRLITNKANYDETFGEAHHVSATAGFNYETWSSKNVSVAGINLSSINLDDLNLATGSPTEGAYGGGQNEYALAGFFARINYDYKGRYLFEVSGRYDGSSRFAPGNRWGLFPSASAGWRISEEPFFGNAKDLVDNLKLRASFGSLGNQNVSSYYTYMRLITNKDFSNYTFDGSIKGKYSSLGAPVASDLTWETAQQWDLGLDLTMLNNRLNFTGDVYIRDTKDMLTDGMALPGVYGADSPSMNSAELRTKGYELSVSWRDQFKLAGKPFEYSVGFNLSDYKSVITKYDNNPNKSLTNLTKGDYYVGMEIGEIWGFKTDGFFKTTEEAQAYAKEVDLSYSTGRLTGGWQAGDLKFVDLDGNGVWGVGNDTVDKPGDRTILGNSLPTLSYGINASIRWMGFDASVFFQGTGNHYWYPHGEMMPFWGCYSYPYLSYLPTDFLGKVWAEDNPNSYFPRARAYSSSGGYLSKVNDRYLQNIRYLRLKNLTVGYTIPATLTKKAGIDQIRIYFSGENLCYWSPLKKNSK